jgi:uncharacterized protein with PIN domain
MGAEEGRGSVEPAGDHPPGSATPLPRCPRCGGAGAPPKYRPRANPFLFKPQAGHLVCEDCGLDYWEDGQGPPPSGNSPW